MPFKDLMGKAQELTGAAAEAGGKLVDELNEALPSLRALGFAITDVHIGMGFLPEIRARLIASTDSVSIQTIKEIIEKHPDNRTLVAALKALQLAYNIKQQIGDPPCQGVEIDVTLGLPPHIAVAFVNSAPVAKAAGAA